MDEESILALKDFVSDEQEAVLDEFPLGLEKVINLMTGAHFFLTCPALIKKHFHHRLFFYL